MRSRRLLNCVVPNQSNKMLINHAWFHEDGPAIVSNVLKYVGEAKKTVLTVIFPECGCGHHEFSVARALKVAGHRISRIVFMDTKVNPIWITEWHRMADELGIEIIILNSYETLDRWAGELQRTAADEHLGVLVIYINGSLLFSPKLCGQFDPETCRLSAVRFWKWCEKTAFNKVPTNFVRTSVFNPAHSSSWLALATTFTSPM